MPLLYKTHLAGGFIAGYLLTGSLTCGAVSAVAALFPDIEDPNSFIGHKMPIVSHVANAAFGHRQGFHSLIASVGASAVGLLAQKLAHLPHWIAIAVLIGYVSHLALDTLNPAGVPWLWPLRLRFRIPLVQTGSLLERLVVMPVATVVSICMIGAHIYPSLNHLRGF